MNRVLVFLKRIVSKFTYLLLLSPILKRTNWYKSLFVEDIYPGNIWYREHKDRNFDLIVLGSSGAKWGFDFSNCSIKAMNWAQQPQSLVEDYNLLRNFHSILRKDGIVIITIMPFTSINKQPGLYDALKYVKVQAHEPIQPYLFEKAKLFANMPLLMGKPAFKALIKFILRKEESLQNDTYSIGTFCTMTEEQFKSNALSFVDGWKKQFHIVDFDAPLTAENRKGRHFRINLMQTIIDFCVERSYKPVFVIPPVSKHLAKYYTDLFEEIYVYSFIKEVNREVQLLDYSKEPSFQKDELYFNSCFLNKKGATIFTNRVLTDLGLIKQCE